MIADAFSTCTQDTSTEPQNFGLEWEVARPDHRGCWELPDHSRTGNNPFFFLFQTIKKARRAHFRSM